MFPKRVPRQGGSEAARRVDALEAGDYDGTGPEEEEEEDLAERFTQSLLEDADFLAKALWTKRRHCVGRVLAGTRG